MARWVHSESGVVFRGERGPPLLCRVCPGGRPPDPAVGLRPHAPSRLMSAVEVRSATG